LKHQNKPKFFDFGFTKQTETQPKQNLLQFVSVRTEIFFVCFEDTELTTGRKANVTIAWFEGGGGGEPKQVLNKSELTNFRPQTSVPCCLYFPQLSNQPRSHTHD
jgi:hypothetical protein